MRSIRELQNLSGRRALITGGAGYVALAVCETLLELGAVVTITDADADACRARREFFVRSYPGDNVHAAVADLSDESQTRRAVREAIDRMDGLHILVHCAGYVGTTQNSGWAAPLGEQTLQAFEAAMRVGAGAAFAMIQEGRAALEASGAGSIILVGSIYGIVGPDLRLYEGTAMANPAGYAASKGALGQLVRYFATVLAPAIRVNSISPGGISRNQPPAFQSRYVERTPLRRMATEEDLKGAVAYLASDLSAYVTGHDLIVDGGWTVW